MPRPLVVSVILNSGRCRDTLECLASLARSDYGNRRTIVLDNDSRDGSVEAVARHFPAVRVIRLERNLGYAGNNNVGIEAALAEGAEWVFVLNEDTVLAPDCLTRLVDAGSEDAHIGVLGPMVYHHDEPQIIQSAGGRMDGAWRAWHEGENEPDRGQFVAPRRVEWISGCAIMVRRAVIEEVGGLDARFFYYWEETEWCLRARRRGWLVVHVPEARLWHKGVQRDYRPKPSVTYYSTRNRLLMMSKHGAPLGAWLSVWGQMSRTLISWSIRPKWRCMREHRRVMWRGILDFRRGRWGAMAP